MKIFIVKFCLAVAFVVAMDFAFGWENLLEQALDFAKTYDNPLAFLLVMSIGCALPLSLAACYLFAGAAFPFFTAFALCLAGLFFSSLLGYCIARFIFPPEWIDALLRKYKIDREDGKCFANANFFVRAIPGIPYFLQNVILGGIRTPLKMYVATNLAVQGTIAAVMVFMGSSATSDLPLAYKVAAFAALVCVLAAVRKILSSIFVRKSRNIAL